jgi:hypothetical protein
VCRTAAKEELIYVLKLQAATAAFVLAINAAVIVAVVVAAIIAVATSAVVTIIDIAVLRPANASVALIEFTCS